MTVYGPRGVGDFGFSGSQDGAVWGVMYGAHATALQFATANPILPLGYFGFENDTGFVKMGDGVSDWNSLSYWRWETPRDVIIDDATKGLVLKDDADPAHYWRVTINSSGVLQQADLGTSRPS